ncbi:5-formyltetrahydrofolate cyclo-ligase [Marispirochaeta sp.]|jgi:5-formyltetrahydrofolate cyclo-ligase|uniref:5-formyltetrahydrofolate cyclo-ligase n=1 Tax=Marispirochaeta sp. TaxID=2038653 RepID=UPI0029C94EF5|nr:5-formyltetrahydrofolate cyclo-ligase [Marispirochaeta sp.]
MEKKEKIRKEIKAALLGLSEREKLRQEREVQSLLLADPLWNSCKWVFGFLPMGHEFNLEPILQSALDSGRRVALPRVEKKRLQFHEINSLNGPWILHAYGMREPGADTPRTAADQLAADGLLIIVPGLAFDRRGYRVGYGGGFYDRLLSDVPENVVTVSCIFREQLVRELPVEPHDRTVRRLVFSAEK